MTKKYFCFLLNLVNESSNVLTILITLTDVPYILIVFKFILLLNYFLDIMKLGFHRSSSYSKCVIFIMYCNGFICSGNELLSQ